MKIDNRRSRRQTKVLRLCVGMCSAAVCRVFIVFFSSWLSFTFSLPLAQICRADSLSQVKPSRRHCCSNPLLPRLHSSPPTYKHTHTHIHEKQTPSATTSVPPSPSPQPGLQGFPLFYRWLLNDSRDHVTLCCGTAAIGDWGEGEGPGTPSCSCAPYHDSTNPSLDLIVHFST